MQCLRRGGSGGGRGFCDCLRQLAWSAFARYRKDWDSSAIQNVDPTRTRAHTHTRTHTRTQTLRRLRTLRKMPMRSDLVDVVRCNAMCIPVQIHKSGRQKETVAFTGGGPSYLRLHHARACARVQYMRSCCLHCVVTMHILYMATDFVSPHPHLPSQSVQDTRVHGTSKARARAHPRKWNLFSHTRVTGPTCRSNH